LLGTPERKNICLAMTLGAADDDAEVSGDG
jgi:hypothetical protein